MRIQSSQRQPTPPGRSQRDRHADPAEIAHRLSCFAGRDALDRDESTARPTMFGAVVAEARATTDANSDDRSPDAIPNTTNEEISPDHVRQPPSRHLLAVTPTERSPP